MRVGVVTAQVPFITGGAERHAANLVVALRARGHEAVEITLPFKWFPARRIVDHVLAAKLTDLSDLGYPVDRVVGLKFPAWLVNHPDKVFWVLHQHRQAYDLWESGSSELLNDPDGPGVRELIRAEDTAALGAPGARVWANSANVAGRMARHLGVTAAPLYHPPPNAGRLRAGAYGDYLFAPSRLGPSKRQALMIEALTHAGPRVRLVIAGPPDDPRYPEELARLARAHGVADRVELRGAVSDEEMLALYAGARAVVFVPVDEDYGYITLEAMLAARPVITVTDAGGPLEFIHDGAEGLVAPPEPAALGAAFERVVADAREAEAMGRAGHDAYHARAISWDTVVETLTDGARPASGARAALVRAPKPETDSVQTGEGTVADGIAGRLRLLARHGQTAVLGVRNTGAAPWAGGEVPNLELVWTDGRGVTRHRGARLAVPGPVAPGEEAEIPLVVDAPAREGGRLVVTLAAPGAGASASVSIPSAQAGYQRLLGGA